MQSNKKVYPKYETKKGQLKPGEKVVKAYLLQDVNVVEFKVCVVRNGKEEEAFGGGAIKKEELTRVATELSEFAHQLELSEAEEKGYRRAKDEENEDQNQDDDENQNEDDLNDDENEQQDDNQEEDEQDDE